MAYKDTDCVGNGMNGCSPACAVIDMIMGDDSSNNLIFTTADGKAHILDLSPLLNGIYSNTLIRSVLYD